MGTPRIGILHIPGQRMVYPLVGGEPKACRAAREAGEDSSADVP
jgi:hypothetical protein